MKKGTWSWVSDVFALSVALATSAGHAQSKSNSEGSLTVKQGVVLCYESGEPARGDWDTNVILAIGRALGPTMTEQGIGIRREPCSVRMPDATCFGAPRLMQCRKAALQRILVASGWMTARFALTGGEPYEAFRRRNHQAVRSAFLYADGALDDPEADEIIDQLRLVEATPDSGGASGSASHFKPLVALYQATVDLNMAALIGHEVAHLFDDQCPMSTEAAVERSGLFAATVNQQLSGQLFCPRFPVIEEVKADRCALRHLYALHHAKQPGLATEDGVSGDFVRRAAADMIAFQALTGWRRFAQLPPGRYVLRPLDQYLYAPYRILLMTAEIHGGRPRPAVCGEAAGLFVHAVQESSRACPDGGGIVTDDLLMIMPPGLEKSWNGAPWTDESLSCGPLD